MQVASSSAGRSIMTDNSQDELERMLQEAERLATQMRAAATASAAHLGSSSHHSTSHRSTTTPPVLVPEPQASPPSQPSPSRAALPLTTVQIGRPPNDDKEEAGLHDKQEDAEDDALSLPSQIEIGPDEDETPDAITTRLLFQSKTNAPYEMEAAIQATHDMAQALHALGAAPAVAPRPPPVAAASPGSPESPLAASTPTTTRMPATPLAAARPLDPFAVAPVPRAAAPNTSSRQVAPPAPPTVPSEGDDDYAPLKDYSFKPSKWTPDESVQWEQVDLAQEDDADYVALRDYSSPTPRKKSMAVSLLPARGGGLAMATPRSKRRRRRRRAAAAFVLIALVAAVAYAYSRSDAVKHSTSRRRRRAQQSRPSPTRTPEPPPQTIRVQPLPWVVSGDARDDEAFYRGGAPHTDDDEDDYDFTVAEIGGGSAGGACHFPLAWLVVPQCHGRESSPTERVEALLQSMLQ